MVKLIMGLKGSGKTKSLVDLATQAAADDHCNVVFIEKNKNLTFDLPYSVRLIHAVEYGIQSDALLRGFLCGIRAANYDITHIYIDNFFKLMPGCTDEEIFAFLAWLEDFSARESVDFVISATADPETADARYKKYF